MDSDVSAPLSWKQEFAGFATPVLPDVAPVFQIRVDSEYHYSVLHHAVVKARGKAGPAEIQAFLEDAIVEFYDVHKGRATPADAADLTRAEALVPSPGRRRGGKALRADASKAIKRDVLARILMRRYGANLEEGKRLLTKEAILVKVQQALAVNATVPGSLTPNA